jgi:hypothetical protein
MQTQWEWVLVTHPDKIGLLLVMARSDDTRVTAENRTTNPFSLWCLHEQ